MVEFDFARPLSAMKYGLLLILASIPAFSLVMIVGIGFSAMMMDVMMGGEAGGGLIIGIVGAVAMVVVSMTATIQVVTFALNSAFNDGMAGYQPMGYIATWTKAFSILIELIYLIVGIIVLFVLAILIMDSAPGLGLLMMVVGGIMFLLTYMGLIPYVCRRVLEG